LIVAPVSADRFRLQAHVAEVDLRVGQVAPAPQAGPSCSRQLRFYVGKDDGKLHQLAGLVSVAAWRRSSGPSWSKKLH